MINGFWISTTTLSEDNESTMAVIKSMSNIASTIMKLSDSSIL